MYDDTSSVAPSIGAPTTPLDIASISTIQSLLPRIAGAGEIDINLKSTEPLAPGFSRPTVNVSAPVTVEQSTGSCESSLLFVPHAQANNEIATKVRRIGSPTSLPETGYRTYVEPRTPDRSRHLTWRDASVTRSTGQLYLWRVLNRWERL